MLFRLTLRGQLRHAAEGEPAAGPFFVRSLRASLAVRLAVAASVVGVGLLTVANAALAHAFGVVALLAAIVFAFGPLVGEDDTVTGAGGDRLES